MSMSPTDSLTPREAEVLELLCSGQTNKQIAAAVSISDQTVKYHLKNIYVKLGAQGRAHAVAIASGHVSQSDDPETVAIDAQRALLHLPQSPLELARRTRRLFAHCEAVVDGDLHFSYAQFFERCDRASGLLAALGVGKGDRVATIAPNSHRHLELFYAVPQIGAVIVPINYRLTEEDFARVIAHSGASVVCVAGEFVEQAERIRKRLEGVDCWIALDGPRPGWQDYESGVKTSSVPVDPVVIDDDDLIAINYTSGTTFEPSGVMITHRNVWLNAVGLQAHWPLRSRDRYLWLLPLAHVNGWSFAWTVTAAGATHVCRSRPSPEEIANLIKSEKITALCAGKTALIEIANCPAELRPGMPRNVRVLTAGASPAAITIEQVEKDFGWEVTHAYGLTETAPFISICDNQAIQSDDPAERARLKARQGVPLLTSGEWRVVDEEHQDVPVDGRTVGEVVVRGGVVMAGYYRDPAATRRAFSGGWFHTGDAAVMHPDGFIEISGRIKDIIISGDELIAPIEIEDILMRHPQVLEASVIGMPDEQLGEAVHAFIVPNTLRNPPTSDLLDFAAEHLARFKLPRQIHFVDTLPKTPTGKVRKLALRELVNKRKGKPAYSAGELLGVEADN